MFESSEQPDRDAIGAALRYLRKHQHLTQTEVADALGATTSVIAQFENGRPMLGRDKIAQLPAVFGCQSLQDMVDKANALPHEPGTDAIGAALRYLREHRHLTQTGVADAIGATTSAIDQFENGRPTLGRDKIAQLPAVFGCQSLQDMVDKANALPPPERGREAERGRDAIGAALRYLREHRHLTQTGVADAVGATQSAIDQFENGRPTLGRDKLAQLPAVFGCHSLQDMVDKANALPPPERGREAERGRDAIGAALRYLRKHRHLTQTEVADAVGATQSAIDQFENGRPTLGRDKLAQLPAVFGCHSLQDMVDKANALPHEPGTDAIGAALRYLRKHRHLTQTEVADAVGATTSAIAQFEKGRPTLGRDKIAQLPAVFGCQSLQDMVDKAGESVPNEYSHRDAVRTRAEKGADLQKS